MKFLNVRLLVKDMKASLTFYHDTLGFEVLFEDPDGEYTELAVGGEATLALYGRESMAQAVGTTHRPAFAECQDSSTLVFSVENVDATVAQLQAKGVTLEAEAQDRQEWMMRTAHFRDVDGNLIEINQALPQCVNSRAIKPGTEVPVWEATPTVLRTEEAASTSKLGQSSVIALRTR